MKENLRVTREEIISIREELDCGLHVAKQILFKRKIFTAINEAETIDDMKEIMKVWLREL